MFRTDGKRADGVFLAPWSKGKCLVWDAICVDTICKSNVSASSQTPGAAAAKAEKKKTDLLLATAQPIPLLSLRRRDLAHSERKPYQGRASCHR